MKNNRKNEIKNSLEGINNRITEAEKRMTRIEDSLRDFWYNI